MECFFKSLAFLVSIVIIGCSQASNRIIDEKKVKPRALTTAESKTVNSYNAFGIKIFKEINKTEETKSVFISPLSISMVLGMALNGAAETTYDSMRATLELYGLTEREINESYKNLIELLTQIDPKVKFQIANSIWHRDGLPVENSFIDTNKKFFDAEVKGLNFSEPAASKIINNWVNERTHGKIKDIVPDPIEERIVMYLINAIYFKGKWALQFDKAQTKDDFFHTIEDEKKPCQMMYNRGDFQYFENQQLQAIDLLYGDSLFSMTILLPKEGLSVNQLIVEINRETLQKWMNEFSTMEGEVYLPRFKLEYKKNLNAALKALGMTIAFTPYKANFSRIAKPENLGGESLYITNVEHKTFVEVDEEGTEAAAVTSVEIGITSVREVFVMRVDRPFVFLIRERSTGTILFIGKMMEV